MPPDCGHLLCALVDGSCSLATGRSRGCRVNLTAKTVDAAVFDEVRTLLAQIDPDTRDASTRAAAVRLAQIVRREALENRHLLAHARDDEPELAPALERLLRRQPTH